MNPVFNALILTAHLGAAHPEAVTAAEFLPPEPPPAEALLVAPSQDEEEDKGWTGSLSIGALNTDGNTDIKSASTILEAERKREKDRTTFGFYWNYNEEDGSVTQRRIGGRAQYDWFKSDKTYYLVQTGAENDAESDLDLRFNLGAGIGQQWYDEEEWKFSSEIGPSWFFEDYKGESSNDYIAARLAYNLDHMHGEKLTFSQSATVFPSLEDSEDIYSKLDSRVRYALTEAMFAQFQWIWDWDNTPASGNDRSDHRHVLTVGWSF